MQSKMERKSKGKVVVVVDGQAGSSGKGKVCGYLASRDRFGIAINNWMSNAGHTWVGDYGTKVMTQHLPTSIVNRAIIPVIGPGAAITPEILINEMRKYSDMIHQDVIIHPRAMIIQEKHREEERIKIRSGSTFKGCGAAQAEKAMRIPNVQLLQDYIHELPRDIRERIVMTDTGQLINCMIDIGINVLIEGSQGFDLDINYGLDYPHTTSRQCHAGQLVADCGISPMQVTDVIMIMRPYPIRISNETELGVNISSGDYNGSSEITWDTVKQRCGAPDGINFGETTTVTKKLRRVFELNWDRLRYAAMINRPTQIVLNFAQYIDWGVYGATSLEQISTKVLDFILLVEKETGAPVTMIGTGPANSMMVDLRASRGII